MEYQNFPGKTSSASAPEIGIPVSSNAGPARYYGEKAREPVRALHVHQKDETSDEAQWSTGLCDCFSNPTNCCITCWCPCITFGQVAEIVDKGYPSCGVSGALYALIAYITGCTCFYSCVYRSKMRKQYSLHGSACNDCLVHCFCECCALCQEYRELEHRGFDMSIGWHGNVERQSRGVVMAPVVEQGMKK